MTRILAWIRSRTVQGIALFALLTILIWLWPRLCPSLPLPPEVAQVKDLLAVPIFLWLRSQTTGPIGGPPAPPVAT